MLHSLMFPWAPESPERRLLQNTGVLWESRHFNDEAPSGGGWRIRVGGASYRRGLPGWREGALRRHGAHGALPDPERLRDLGRSPGDAAAGVAATCKTLRGSVQGHRGRAKGPVA